MKKNMYFCMQNNVFMQMSRKSKIITMVSSAATVALGIFIWLHFFFVYSTGVNAGDLNYFQKEGIVFKTYEGRIIQSGFKSAGKGTDGLHSNELKFSVTDNKVADRLMRASGKHVELRWKRYMGTLPWRGNSQYVVTEVLSTE